MPLSSHDQQRKPVQPNSKFEKLAKLTLVAMVSLLTLPGPFAIAQTENGLSAEQNQRLNQIATRDVPKDAPGIATGLVLDGKIIYSKCAGLEDITNQSAITPQSRFNIASNGKQFTALAIIQLEAAGKLSYQDDIRTFFPKLFGNIPSPITIEHLLTHTSGIRDVYRLWSLQGLTWWKNEFDNDDVMTLLEQQEALNFAPGTQFLYSNSNYILLAEIVNQVSGTTFIDYTNEMFQQLGMPNTSFENDHTNIRGPVARPYFNFNTWQGYRWTWNVCGDGSLFSTLEDQLQWECLVQGHGTSKFDRELIKRSQQLVNPALTKTYGFGLEFANQGTVKSKFHEGATGAWKAYILRIPDENLSVITLTNSGKVSPAPQTLKLAEAFLNRVIDSRSFAIRPSSTGPRVTAEEILGTYRTDNGFAFQFIQTDGQLFLRRSGRNDVLLERESANVFHQKTDPNFKQEFVRTVGDCWQVTAYHNSHPPYQLTQSKIDLTEFDADSIVGSYFNSETNSVIEVTHDKDRNFSLVLGKRKRKAQLVSFNKLVSGDYVIQWPGESKKQPYLSLSNDRIMNVQFKRKPTDQ
ncbi:MAG: serine hydrolase domain-containing protein [Planctomycetota bacterium]